MLELSLKFFPKKEPEMNCFKREIQKFVSTISRSELEKNQVLKEKISSLLKKAELIDFRLDELKSIRPGVKRFINPEFLNQ